MSYALQAAGLVDLSKSIYTAPNFTWLSFIVGGFLFGVGMTLGSGCGSKTLIRIGGGNLKSLVVYVFLAISAYMTLRGLFGQFRVSVLQPVAVNFEAYGIKGQDLPSLLAATGADLGTLRLAIAGVVAAALLLFVFKDREFRANPNYVLGGIVVGLLIVAGWYVTGHLGYKENPDTLEMTFFGTNTRAAESFSFVAPLAYTLELLMLWTDKSLAADLRHHGGARRDRRLVRLRQGERQLPLGKLRRRRRPRQPHDRRHIDGFRRRHRARLHHRPGHQRVFDAGAGLDRHFRLHHRRLGGDHEVPILEDHARSVSARGGAGVGLGLL